MFVSACSLLYLPLALSLWRAWLIQCPTYTAECPLVRTEEQGTRRDILMLSVPSLPRDATLVQQDTGV